MGTYLTFESATGLARDDSTVHLSDSDIATLKAALGIAVDFWGEAVNNARRSETMTTEQTAVLTRFFGEEKQKHERLLAGIERAEAGQPEEAITG